MTDLLPRTAPSPLADASPLAWIPRGAKVLWVASTGGHLSELAAIDSRIASGSESRWVTFDSEQSRGLLSGRRTFFVDYVAPRDLKAALRAAHRVRTLLRREQFDACISTGAAVATAILPMAAARRIPTYYIESLARPTGPSVTGRILAWAPGVHTLTQYQQWASASWPYAGSTLDDWTVTRNTVHPGPKKILVTLGTIQPYRFDRAVDAVLDLLDDRDEVIWQLGATTRTDLPGRVTTQVSPQQMATWSRAADVVVTHAGVGSILQQFEIGHSPVLAVRSGAHQEHVDNHQLGIAQSTAERGLTSILDLDRPCRSVLDEAAARSVATTEQTNRRSDLLRVA